MVKMAPALGRLAHRHDPAMGNDGARRDIQPKPGAAVLVAPSLPETAEDLVSADRGERRARDRSP